MSRLRVRPFIAVFAVSGAMTSNAFAHFQLIEPKPDRTNDPDGKAPPCGDQGTPTTDVTTYRTGQMIKLTLKETVTHGGHYRVAMAKDGNSLPPEPKVTSNQESDCGSAPIDSNPKYPILADGLFTNLTPQNGPQSVQIMLPEGVTCDNCVLQVIQFMTPHGLNPVGGCFYHHCARVTVSDSAPLPPPASDAGPEAPGSSPDGGNNNSGNSGSTGSCSTVGGNASWLIVALGVVAPGLRRRRAALR